MVKVTQDVPWAHLLVFLPSYIIQLEFYSLVGVSYFNVMNTKKQHWAKWQKMDSSLRKQYIS